MVVLIDQTFGGRFLPIISQPLHLLHLFGVGWVKVQVETAIDGWNCPRRVKALLEQPGVPRRD